MRRANKGKFASVKKSGSISDARPGESMEDYERRKASERERQGNGSKGVFSGSYGD